MKKVLMVAAFLVFAFALVGCSAGSAEPSGVEVPDTIGQNADDAKSVLRDAGFRTVDLIEDDGGTVYIASAYTVVSQEPSAGSRISASDKVTLTVKNEALAKANEAKQAEADAEAALDGAVGGEASDVMAQLADQGYSVTLLLGTIDYTSTVAEGAENPDDPFLVTGYDLDFDHMKVELSIDTQSGIDQAAASDAVRAALEEKLPASYAWTAAESYGKAQYPYGFKLKDFMGRMAEEPKDESTWFLRATCNVTNENGAKAKDLVCEAEVTGTKDAPEVVSFMVY